MSDKTCTCIFVAIGVPMDTKGCEVHTQLQYKCDLCSCRDYKPSKVPKPEHGYWPLCVCGHTAQDHN